VFEKVCWKKKKKKNGRLLLGRGTPRMTGAEGHTGMSAKKTTG